TLPDGRSACAVPEPDDEVLTCEYWKRRTDLNLTDGPHSALVSSWLGRPVRLARAPRGDVVYGAPATMIATASLADLADRAARPARPGPPRPPPAPPRPRRRPPRRAGPRPRPAPRAAGRSTPPGPRPPPGPPPPPPPPVRPPRALSRSAPPAGPLPCF